MVTVFCRTIFDHQSPVLFSISRPQGLMHLRQLFCISDNDEDITSVEHGVGARIEFESQSDYDLQLYEDDAEPKHSR